MKSDHQGRQSRGVSIIPSVAQFVLILAIDRHTPCLFSFKKKTNFMTRSRRGFSVFCIQRNQSYRNDEARQANPPQALNFDGDSSSGLIMTDVLQKSLCTPLNTSSAVPRVSIDAKIASLSSN